MPLPVVRELAHPGPRPPWMTEELFGVLALASLAPSGHNTQPWAVEVRSDEELLVRLDPARLLPAVDPRAREAWISVGAFVETFVVACGERGYEVDVRPEREAVRLVRGSGGRLPSPDERIVRRRTHRGLLRREALAPDDVTRLIAAAGDVRYVACGTSEARVLGEATVDANRVQSARDEAQEELVRWVRWTRGEARRTRDGLTLEALGIGLVERTLAGVFASKSVLMSAGSRRRAVGSAARAVAASGGWLVVASEGDGWLDAVDAGRRFARVALRAAALGVGMGPMSQALEEEPFGTRIREVVRSGVPQMLVRVGYLDGPAPAPVSPRREVVSFVRGL